MINTELYNLNRSDSCHPCSAGALNIVDVFHSSALAKSYAIIYDHIFLYLHTETQIATPLLSGHCDVLKGIREKLVLASLEKESSRLRRAS